MSFSIGLTRKQNAVVLAVLVAAACATPTEDIPTDSVEVAETGGTGGDVTASGGMAAVGGDDMGVGGTGGAGGAGSAGGAGGTGGSGGVGGSAAGTGGMMMTGGKGGKGEAGQGAGGTAAGKGGSANGGMGTGGTGKGTAGTATAFGGSAGMATATGGKGGSAGMEAAGGKGSAGKGGGGTTGTGGKGAAGTTGAGGKATGGAGTSGQMCVTSLMPNTNSGDLGSTAVCFDVTGNVAGWQVSNLGTRTLTVNGTAAAPPTVPPAVNGHRIFEFGAGSPTYTGWSYW